MMLTKTQDQAGVSLLDLNGNYRSTYEILQDIADIWEQIAKEDLETGQNRQNALLEMMAGKNRSNILASILQSPDILRDVYESSQNSEGSAQKELEKYLDSVEGKLEKLSNSAQKFWSTYVDTELVKWAIDRLTDVMNLLTNIAEVGNGLPLTIAAIMGAFKVKDLINGKSGGRAKNNIITISKFALKQICLRSVDREVYKVKISRTLIVKVSYMEK